MYASLSILSDPINRIFEQRKNKPNVLVIGYGWGSSAFVQGLDTNKYNVKVISTRPQRLNQPRMINDLAPSYSPPPYRIPIIQDECLTLEDTKKQVVCKTQSHTYDYLVIATGSEVNDFGIPGIKENCLLLKTEEDLEKLNSALKTPKPITIAGAGPTGLELAFRLNSPTQPVTVLEASPFESEDNRHRLDMLENCNRPYTNQRTRNLDMWHQAHKFHPRIKSTTQFAAPSQTQRVRNR
jgi:Pyridine nucleotide-disulphide oxidoreductase